MKMILVGAVLLGVILLVNMVLDVEAVRGPLIEFLLPVLERFLYQKEMDIVQAFPLLFA